MGDRGASATTPLRSVLIGVVDEPCRSTNTGQRCSLAWTPANARDQLELGTAVWEDLVRCDVIQISRDDATKCRQQQH